MNNDYNSRVHCEAFGVNRKSSIFLPRLYETTPDMSRSTRQTFVEAVQASNVFSRIQWKSTWSYTLYVLHMLQQACVSKWLKIWYILVKNKQINNTIVFVYFFESRWSQQSDVNGADRRGSGEGHPSPRPPSSLRPPMWVLTCSPHLHRFLLTPPMTHLCTYSN